MAPPGPPYNGPPMLSVVYFGQPVKPTSVHAINMTQDISSLEILSDPISKKGRHVKKLNVYVRIGFGGKGRSAKRG